MTLAVGHGYDLPYLLDLPLTAFEDLAASIMRVSRKALAESSMAMHLAAQGQTKDLMKYLKALTGAKDSADEKKTKAAAHIQTSQEMNRSKRRGR